MNAKELMRVAGLVQEALGGLRKGRYQEYVRQVSRFTGRLQDLARESRKLGLALTPDCWRVAF